MAERSARREPSGSAASAPLSEAEVLARIAAIARQHLEYEEPLDRDQSLVEDLGLDSVRVLTLAVEVEDAFRVCLDPEDEEGIVTLGDLVDVVLAKKTATSRESQPEPEDEPEPDPDPDDVSKRLV